MLPGASPFRAASTPLRHVYLNPAIQSCAQPPKRRKASRKLGFYGPCSGCADVRELHEYSGPACPGGAPLCGTWYCDMCFANDECDMQTPRKRKRSDQNHADRLAFSCSACGKTFGTRLGLAIHIGKEPQCQQKGAHAGGWRAAEAEHDLRL